MTAIPQSKLMVMLPDPGASSAASLLCEPRQRFYDTTAHTGNISKPCLLLFSFPVLKSLGSMILSNCSDCEVTCYCLSPLCSLLLPPLPLTPDTDARGRGTQKGLRGTSECSDVFTAGRSCRAYTTVLHGA